MRFLLRLRLATHFALGMLGLSLASCGSGHSSSGESPDGSVPRDGSASDGAGESGTAESGVPDSAVPVKADFFVSPAGTDTAGCGKLANPCKTIAYTQPLVQALVKTNPARTVTVMLRGNAGPLWLAAPLSFGSADSGTMTTPILWSAYPGETPVVSGGVQVTGKWTSTPSAGGLLWTTSLPASTVDFDQLFIAGKRHYTPRAPATSGAGYLYNVGPVCLTNTDPKFSAAVCKIADTKPARCPTATPYECFDRFVYTSGDISPAWKNITVSGAAAAHPILIDVFEDWTVSKLRLTSVDDTNHIAYLTGPTALSPEFHGFLAGHRYVVENVEDFLTAESGGFYVDESSKPWTLQYFTKAGDDPSSETVVVPQQTTLLGTPTPLAYVTLQGITFSHDNWTVPAVGYPSIQAEPNVSSAVTFIDASHVTIDSCIFTAVQGHALEIKGSGTKMGTGSNTVENSAFYDLGGGGIRIGEPTAGQYSDAEETGGNTVNNNVVTGGGRIVVGSPLIFVGNSDSNVVEHNEVYDGYGDGISVCVPGGGTSCPMYGNHFSYNHVHDIKQGVTSDGGGIYIFSQNVNHVSTPNVIDHNWVHDIADDPGPGGYGGICLYVDNQSMNVTVEDNLAYRSSAEAMFVNYGKGHTITNNILAFGQKGVIGRGYDVVTTGALNVPAFVATKNIFLWDMNASISASEGPGDAFPQSSSIWDCFGMACSTQFQFASNLYWSVAKGVTAPKFLVAPDTTQQVVPFTGAGSWQTTYGEDKGSSYADPGFTNATCPTDDYTFASLGAANAIGFVQFDYKSAGRTAPVIMPPTLSPAFPLQVPADKCTFY